MPEKKTKQRASRARAEGKAPSTQAGEFVREEMHHVREGKHGARSAKQAIAIGLSKARRAGVKLKPPKRGATSKKTQDGAKRDAAAGQRGSRREPSKKRSTAAKRALRREPRDAASHRSLSRQGHAAASTRGASARSAAAKKGARTKGARTRSAAAKKGARARTRTRRATLLRHGRVLRAPGAYAGIARC